MADQTHVQTLQRTPLYDLHRRLHARLVPFAGYEMPVQYAPGIVAEHLHTRDSAGLFDVSHMGQGWLIGPDHETTARALEALVPADILSLEPGQQRYTQLLNDEGGIIDDLMVSRSASPGSDGRLYLIVNASRKAVDFDHLRARLAGSVRVEERPNWALLALQGPRSAAVLERVLGGVSRLGFMTGGPFSLANARRGVYATRSGYTGEDGFEITVSNEDVARLWSALLDQPDVLPIGLGARDSLRLEAGLCLYGHDIDETTSPVEAGLAWSIGKRRRAEGGFPGAERILRELAKGAPRRRVGIRPEGRAPAREGAPIEVGGSVVGRVTSGGFGPSLGAPIAMGYVTPEAASVDTALDLVVRGKAIPARVAKLPFVAHRYRR